MNIQTLARRNLTGHAQRYFAYFFSCVFAVTVFFIYAQFIYHPDVTEGAVPFADAVKQGMIGAQYIIIIFSIFFYCLFEFRLSKSPFSGIWLTLSIRDESSTAQLAYLH